MYITRWMNIGILGSGEVGRRLADGFIKLGHTVEIGTRNTNKDEVVKWVSEHSKQGGKALAGTFKDAAIFGEIIVIATSWDGTPTAIEMAGPNNFSRKIVIDVTNPLDFSKGMPPKLSLGFSDSAGENIQRQIPEARVVKAFNIVGNPHFVNPDFPNGGPPTMFIAGDNVEAKKTVTDNILTKFGWETVDIGGMEGSRLLEPLAYLWITYYLRTGKGDHAFKLLKK
jgi:8-hydroxy-5-deazaflavin:NADPH oxidoreductase